MSSDPADAPAPEAPSAPPPRELGPAAAGGLAGAVRPHDLTRTTFAVLALALLVGASLWVLRPFLGPTIWATMVVVATWPLMRRIELAAGGRRWVAVTVMTCEEAVS